MGMVTKGYWGQMIEDIMSCQPEASQSDKQLQSYGWLKICCLKTQICICQAPKSLKFSGGTPADPLTHLQTGIYDCMVQVYTDASTYRPRR